MEEKKKTNKCKECGIEIKVSYTYCSICYKTKNKEIVVTYYKGDDFDKTVDFYRILIINKFMRFDRITLTFEEEDMVMADTIVKKMRHMGVLQEKRERVIEKDTKPPHNEQEHIKAELYLMGPLAMLKKDKGMRFYD